jgi:hypothetical protein
MSKETQDAAERILAKPHVYPGLLPVPEAEMRLWIYPSFAPYASWSVHRAMSRIIVRRVVAQPRISPLEAGTGMQSYASEADVAESEVSATLASFECLDLVALARHPPQGLGIDGTVFGIQRGCGPSAQVLEWWSVFPPALSSIAEWHRITRRLLNGFLPACSVPLKLDPEG